MSTLSLSSIIVSFSLMVAMAIMVYSFRVSFERWLDKVLPADVQVREPFGNDTAYWTAADQTAAAAAPGVSRAEFRRTRPLYLDPAQPPVTLIARGATAGQTQEELPLLTSLPAVPRGSSEPAWISEELQDLYGYRLGEPIDLPLNGRNRRFVVAGIWRTMRAQPVPSQFRGTTTPLQPGYRCERRLDLARSARAGRLRHREAARRPIAQRSGRQRRARDHDDAGAARAFAQDLRSRLRHHLCARSHRRDHRTDRRELRGELHRARAPFGIRMLRHIGMRRAQVLGMLASEGVLMSACAVAYGLLLGGILSLVLVFVVNRQSFNWSIELALPVAQLGLLSLALIAAAALTAVWSGRAATRREAVGAVREDW